MKARDVRRVVAVGCSFTHGDEVAATESWAALVDRDAKELELANLGFGAYGLDQALLRLRRDGLPLAPDEVWMGLLPSAAPRVASVYRPVQRHWSSFIGFKPRYVLEDDGGLMLVVNPARTLADVPRLLGDQEAFLAATRHDLWVQRGRWAYLPRGSHWTHYTATSRIALTLWERGARDPAGWLLDPGLEVRSVLTAIVLDAARVSEDAGARFRFLVLPARKDVDAPRPGGEPYWGPFLDDLRAEGVDVIDVTGALEAARAGGPELWTSGEHYTPAGNRVVADAILAAVGP